MDPAPPPPPQLQPSVTDVGATPPVASSGPSIGNVGGNTAAGNGDVVVRGSIAERRAAKFGFNAERINDTARFRTASSPLASPAATVPSSALITIPAGISPTALLDSPVMLRNSLLSPTTGTFPSSLPKYANSKVDVSGDGEWGSHTDFSFKLKPHEPPDFLPGFSTFESQGNNVDIQALVPVGPSMDFEFPVEFPKEATSMSCTRDCVGDANVYNSIISNTDIGEVRLSRSDAVTSQTATRKEPVSGEYLSAEDLNGTFSATGIARTSEDGYSWRKYGQKQVKGSEFPRSYYKCTHQSCQVTKKIERSHDGQITEIIYKGAHNHPKPQPSRRSQLGSPSPYDEMPETEDGSGTCSNIEGKSVWKTTQSGCRDAKLGSDGRVDGLERTSSMSVITQISDVTQAKSVAVFESADTPEFSSTLASNGDPDDGATEGSISLGVEDEADEEESQPKRRKIESCQVETNLASRAVREPRVVVQIESEVDILDDGYRWRKCGQKVVKGNPNPRSYYKCTTPGCLVRKHVERASHDLKYVITTYDGKHNHEVPAAKNSSHISDGSLPHAAANTHSALALGRHTNGTKQEAQIQDFAPSFDRKRFFNSDFLKHSFPGNFNNEMKAGASSLYPMKFPAIQNNISYGSFGFNSNHNAAHQSGAVASFVQDFPISLPPVLHKSANVSLAGIDSTSGGKSVGPVQPYFSGQQLIRPKREHNDENLYRADPSIYGRMNAAASSLTPSIYQSMMRNFPS